MYSPILPSVGFFDPRGGDMFRVRSIPSSPTLPYSPSFSLQNLGSPDQVYPPSPSLPNLHNVSPNLHSGAPNLHSGSPTLQIYPPEFSVPRHLHHLFYEESSRFPFLPVGARQFLPTMYPDPFLPSSPIFKFPTRASGELFSYDPNPGDGLRRCPNPAEILGIDLQKDHKIKVDTYWFYSC